MNKVYEKLSDSQREQLASLLITQLEPPEHLSGVTPQQWAKVIRLFLTQDRVRFIPDFLAECSYADHMKCLMVPWCGMYLGVEPDGYAHS